jgi:uncharacterized integral membrane protein
MVGERPGPDGITTRRLIGVAVVLLLLVVFIAENFSVVEVRLFISRVETRLAWALLLAGALGFAGGWLAARVRR